MNRVFTCIVCPVGCEMEARIDDTDEGPFILEITGANCIRGREYIENELKNPMRIVTSSVRVTGGNMPVTSVRLTAPVPRNRMMDVIEELRHISLTAPLAIGQIVAQNILGLGSDVIITKNVDKRN
jgi:CxxC motif-containing protein